MTDAIDLPLPCESCGRVGTCLKGSDANDRHHYTLEAAAELVRQGSYPVFELFPAQIGVIDYLKRLKIDTFIVENRTCVYGDAILDFMTDDLEAHKNMMKELDYAPMPGVSESHMRTRGEHLIYCQWNFVKRVIEKTRRGEPFGVVLAAETRQLHYDQMGWVVKSGQHGDVLRCEVITSVKLGFSDDPTPIRTYQQRYAYGFKSGVASLGMAGSVTESAVYDPGPMCFLSSPYTESGSPHRVHCDMLWGSGRQYPSFLVTQ